MILIAMVFVASVAGLAYMANEMVANNKDLENLKQELATARQQKAAQDANTTKPPEKATDVVDTPVSKKKEKEQEQIDRTIENSFTIINALSEPGELEFDNRALTALVEALTRQNRQQQAREAELLELEAHLKDQLMNSTGTPTASPRARLSWIICLNPNTTCIASRRWPSCKISLAFMRAC